MIHAHERQAPEALFTLALLAFFLRDLGVIAWRRFARNGAPGDLGVVLSLGALYLLGGLSGRLFGGAEGQATFLPSEALPGLSAVMGLIEAIAIWALAAYRISRPTRGRAIQRPRRTVAPSAPRKPLSATPTPSSPPSPLEGEEENDRYL
jgi:hypothetical protein